MISEEKPMRSLSCKSLTKITDLTIGDVSSILQEANRMRIAHNQGIRREDFLQGRVVAMVFEKPSLRTKVAFEVATHYLGGVPIFLSSEQILSSGGNQRGRESIPDIARNLERFVDLIVARVYQHVVIDQIAEYSHVPVINALCDSHHPTQALADLMALQIRVKKPLPKIKVSFVGDGNNVANSLMQVCALLGIGFAIASPRGFELPESEVKYAQELANKSGSKILLCQEPKEAVKNADVVYADTFTSMGQEAQREERLEIFKNYQVTKSLMEYANPEAVFMHCLPAHRGEEVTDEVMDSPNSIVFDQAECRLHIAKALLKLLI